MGGRLHKSNGIGWRKAKTADPLAWLVLSLRECLLCAPPPRSRERRRGCKQQNHIGTDSSRAVARDVSVRLHRRRQFSGQIFGSTNGTTSAGGNQIVMMEGEQQNDRPNMVAGVELSPDLEQQNNRKEKGGGEQLMSEGRRRTDTNLWPLFNGAV
ncbi:hypothetical protein niasHT_021605 [Heterodera trifolii]|uniref:Uncharacterized protein n=1 Tax=Heterodera trifolii TaxID=157864 RepID=A0ABD2JBQ3_9BILA